jgi:hypothetical protein
MARGSCGVHVHTDLVEATLVREDGDVSVVACASCMTSGAVSICTCTGQTQASRGSNDAPDMMAAGIYVCLGCSALGAARGGNGKL